MIGGFWRTGNSLRNGTRNDADDDQLARSADELYVRYSLACEFKDAPDREKILLALRRWLAAIDCSNWAITFVENTSGMKDAIQSAKAGDQVGINPVLGALLTGVGRTRWFPSNRVWNRGLSLFASLAAEPVFAAAMAEPAAAAAAGKMAWDWGYNSRNPSPGQSAWGLTGPLWFSYGAYDLSEWTANAIWAAAGGRPVPVRAPETRDTLLQKWLPLLEAFAAGAWVLWIGPATVYVAVTPKMLFDDRSRVHCADGPAFFWLDDIRAYYWHGIYVPEHVIMAPAKITVAEIDNEPNAEVRRVLIERCKSGGEIHGPAAYMRDAGGRRIDHDEGFGTLWRREIGGDEPIVMLEVINATRESDGSFKHYWLRVPPGMKTAREATAWTFDIPVERYAPIIET
jgi:hypothetical protein